MRHKHQLLGKAKQNKSEGAVFIASRKANRQ